MRKMIGVLMMVVVVGGFIMATRGRIIDNGRQTQNTDNQEAESNQKIATIEEQLDTNYPTEPAEVIATHNELMKTLYGRITISETLENYIRTIRKLYSTNFLDLNAHDKQLKDLESEMQTIESLKIDLVSSEIKTIYVLKDEEGKEMTAKVKVRHTTNQGNIDRIYFLINEEGLWKINAWENEYNTEQTKPSSVQ